MEIKQKSKIEKFKTGNYDNIHFWQFPPNIMIKLGTNFRKKFFKKAILYFGRSLDVGIFLNKKARKYGFNRKDTGSSIRKLKTSDKDKLYIPQWVIKELALEMGYDLNEVENCILGYRARAGSTFINPNLPVRVTPEFDSILCHIICDGTERRTKNIAASYTQYDVKGRINFYQKLINVFGEINPPSFSKNRKGKDVGIPKAALLIIKNYYSIKSISTYKSSIPASFIYKPKEHRLAILCSFLVDEGAIYDMISLRMKNLTLIKSLKKITLSLGYKCSKKKINKFKDYTNSYVYGFNISNLSLRKLADDIKGLSQKYPTCGLAHKQKYFDMLANQKRTSDRTRYFGKTKELMLTFIKEEPKTTMELARLVGIARRTARMHLKDLESLNKVKIDNITNKGAKVWVVKSH